MELRTNIFAAGIGAPAYAVPERSGGMSRARRRSADSPVFAERNDVEWSEKPPCVFGF